MRMRCTARFLVIVLLAVGCSPTTNEEHAHETGSVDSVHVVLASPGGVADHDSVWVLPLPELGYNAREGRALFDYYCVVCHGAEGHGDGFNAYNLDPKPRNLADSEFQVSRSDNDLSEVIRSGGVAVGLSTGMPPWGRTINERDIANIVIFLRTLSDSLR